MSAKKDTQTAKGTTAKRPKGFTAAERAAMKERARELEAEARRGRRGPKGDGEGAVLAKIAEMQEPDRAMAERLHAIIKAAAPALSPRTWYGMPAYAKDGKVLCFFQSAQKFKTRYATFGFSDQAHLDDGVMWPTAFALKELTPAEAKRIAAGGKKAGGGGPEGPTAAEARYSAADEVDVDDLARWLVKARDIQWDYRNLARRKGRLERLK
jgi:uncharacterized protein YdhG (YjbR/CyaY superfamily)